MKLLFTRSAGFDPPVSAEIELSDLPGEFGRSLEALRELAVQMARTRQDSVFVAQPRYAITIPGDGPPVLAVLYESHIGRELRPLIDELTRRARAAPSADAVPE